MSSAIVFNEATFWEILLSWSDNVNDFVAYILFAGLSVESSSDENKEKITNG